jgi:hypothetical protein
MPRREPTRPAARDRTSAKHAAIPPHRAVTESFRRRLGLTYGELHERAKIHFGGREQPFTHGELAEILGLSRTTLWRERRRGRLSSNGRSGRLLRYTIEDALAYALGADPCPSSST